MKPTKLQLRKREEARHRLRMRLKTLGHHHIDRLVSQFHLSRDTVYEKLRVGLLKKGIEKQFGKHHFASMNDIEELKVAVAVLIALCRKEQNKRQQLINRKLKQERKAQEYRENPPEMLPAKVRKEIMARHQALPTVRKKSLREWIVSLFNKK